MYPYKVLYLDNPLLEKTVDSRRKGNIDGYSTSREVEALLIEEHKNGYELVSITTLNGTIIKSPYTINTTIGLMITLKLSPK